MKNTTDFNQPLADLENQQDSQAPYRNEMEEELPPVVQTRLHPRKLITIFALAILFGVIVIIIGVTATNRSSNDSNQNINVALSPEDNTPEDDPSKSFPPDASTNIPYHRSLAPSANPQAVLTNFPSNTPQTENPSGSPQQQITDDPSVSPLTSNPTDFPSNSPQTNRPSGSPQTGYPSDHPSSSPQTDNPSGSPLTNHPSDLPSDSPQTAHPSDSPHTGHPSDLPSNSPETDHPSGSPQTNNPSGSPQTDHPSGSPLTNSPSNSPKKRITNSPSDAPQKRITSSPSGSPEILTDSPSDSPTKKIWRKNWGLNYGGSRSASMTFFSLNDFGTQSDRKEMTGIRLFDNKNGGPLVGIQFQFNNVWGQKYGGGGNKKQLIFHTGEYINRFILNDGGSPNIIRRLVMTTNENRKIEIGDLSAGTQRRPEGTVWGTGEKLAGCKGWADGNGVGEITFLWIE